MPTALLVEQTFHASLVEGVGDEVEGGSGVAMFPGRPDHRHPIHQVGTQQLVFDLDLVLCEEEGMVAQKQLSADGVGVWVEQPGCEERAETLFLGQRRILLEGCQKSSRNQW